MLLDVVSAAPKSPTGRANLLKWIFTILSSIIMKIIKKYILRCNLKRHQNTSEGVFYNTPH